ncbi:unnamed protein product [Ectocarpus sp. 6 AP-2014]
MCVAFAVPPAQELPYPVHRRTKQAVSHTSCLHLRDTAVVPARRSRTSSRDPPTNDSSSPPWLVTYEIEDIHVKEEQQQEQEQNDGQQERARSGKRKPGSMANALRRHSAWTVSSRQSNHAESPTRLSSKRQRKAFAPGTIGGGTAATRKTPSSRQTARYYGQGHQCCRAPGCTTRPSYGEAGIMEAEFCSQHSKAGMIRVFGKKCDHPGCIKQPSYGKADSNKAEFCAQHAQHGMVHLHAKKCGHPGCTKGPSYGTAGSKKAEFCSQHRERGMINVRSRRCGHSGCTKHPTYGKDGTKKPEFCAQHAKSGMTNVKAKRCGHPGCSKQAVYGKAGSKKGEFCSQHRERGIINVRHA